ncbi:MAG TPA: BMP family ABC transporter substrate-binding protein [Clostridiaceae bacterium]|jgi:basic membrane protein A|nr:BMP family ABC transporter substrate-binding protein [Clostridiaceae bacterium]
MKKRMIRLLSLILVLVLGLGIVACKKSEESAGTGTQPDSSAPDGAKAAGDYKIVLILPGPINDQSWNATNYAGLVACNDQLGTKIEYVENVKSSDYESTFREYAERKYDLVMAAGTQFDEPAAAVAPNYPDTTFCVVNGSKADGDNVAPIFPKEYEASYLASVIAGNVSENGNFATIGGFPNEPMEKLLSVYEKHAVAIAKERGLADAKATRAYANSWDDVALGKQMGAQMIDNGADTLFVYANEVGLGSIEAAKEKGAKFIGFSSDQNSVAPETVVASVIFDFETFYVWAVDQYVKGTLSGNKVHEAGIKEGIFKPVYGPDISDEVKAAVEAAIEDYKAGKTDLSKYFDK